MVRPRTRKEALGQECFTAGTKAFLHWMVLFAATGLLDDFGFGSYKFTQSAVAFACGAVAINMLAFSVYSIDKALSFSAALGKFSFQVPELLLLALNLVGGVPFAAFAMWLYGHKCTGEDTAFRGRFVYTSDIFMKLMRWLSGIVVVIFVTYWIQQHQVVARPMD